MANKTIEELKSEAAVVRDATEEGENTATRVGTVMIDMIDSLSNATVNGIKGYMVIDSTSELPTNPTSDQQMIGYLLDTTLYVYVGTGGDTLDGKYKSADLKGPQGATGPAGADGHDGVSLGEVALVNNLTEGGEESALTAEQGKMLRDNLLLIYDALSEGAFWNGKPTLTWVSGSTFQVINNLNGVANSNTATSVQSGSTYSGTLTASVAFDVTITMGGVDVTSLVYNSTTGAISIAEVTGNIIITAVAEVTPAITIYDGYEISTDGSMVASTGKSCTDFIPMEACKLVWSAGALGTASSRFNLVIYNEQKEYIEYYNNNANYRIIDLTTHAQASNIAYVRITFATSKVSTRICYDITNSVYIFKGEDYDGRYDNMNWGYKRVKDGGIYKTIADNTHAMTELLPLLAGCQSVTWDAGENTAANLLVFTDSSHEMLSHWGNTPEPRTLQDARLNNGTWADAIMTINLAGSDSLDGAYLKDNTNDTYLFKGLNIE